MIASSPLVCPECHRQLTFASNSVECTSCGARYPVDGGIIDFALGDHYDRFTPSDQLSTDHASGLELEIEGSRRRITDFYLPLVRATTPAAHRVLDCGCGNGVSVETLVALGYDAWGNDLSELRAWQWRQRSIPDHLVIANAQALPFPDGYFDVVISSGVIEHIGVQETAVPRYVVRPLPDRDARRLAFLRELGRVLAPGGALFLDCPNGAFPIDFWHGNRPGRPRWHSIREGFLPHYDEIRLAAQVALPGASVTALSPHNRLQFRQAAGHLHGRLLAPAASLLFRAMTWRPLRWLARSPVNPFLVVRITAARS